MEPQNRTQNFAAVLEYELAQIAVRPNDVLRERRLIVRLKCDASTMPWLLPIRAFDERLRFTEQLAQALHDLRAPARIEHGFLETLAPSGIDYIVSTCPPPVAVPGNTPLPPKALGTTVRNSDQQYRSIPIRHLNRTLLGPRIGRCDEWH